MSPIVATEPFVGVDTVRVRGGLVEVPDLTEFPSYTVSRTRGAVSARVPLGNGARLMVDTLRGPAAAIEFSVPRFLTGSNLVPSTWPQTLEAVEDAFDRATRFVEWDAPSAAHLSLMRVDAVRHLHGVGEAEGHHLIDGLRVLPVARTPKVQTWERHGALNSLRQGAPGRWTVRLYMKATEIRQRARNLPTASPERVRLEAEACLAEGVLRFEATVRSPVLRERGMGKVREMNSAGLEGVCRRYFERARFNEEVAALDKVKAALLTVPEADYKDASHAVLVMMLDAWSMPSPYKTTTDKRLRALGRAMGLTQADLVNGGSMPSLRLDFDSGRAVVGGEP